MKDKLKSIADAKDDKWGVFFGWDPELISDLPALSIAFLDENFSREIPIFVVGQSGHVAWANSIAFSQVGVSTGLFLSDPSNFYPIKTVAPHWRVRRVPPSVACVA